ncbi:HAMP domain-containing sensor histidine kinase [Clostridium sp. DJ247]|uniref:HAMP domain-containing sensor histidine kinase n=1 Tax=Clostridium sp. DJ247 TaxID=2726188 RepID=UPI00162A2613|nr:HAMP domain-containing sensor histidine kinase [Clostridium sp. DJ247]MBC2580987.1 HAMP domain-containing protein [Clostridium sp. DJ247]
MNLSKLNISKIKKSITLKLFIVTALVFIIFISSTLIIQSLFFGRFYMEKKRHDLQQGIEKFKITYNKTGNDEKVLDLIREFEDSSNAKIVILDNSGKLKFITKAYGEKVDSARIRIINDVIRKWTINSDVLLQMKKDNKSVTIITGRKDDPFKNIVSATPNINTGEVIFALSSLQPVSEASSVIKEFYFYFYIGAVVLIIILSLVYSNMVSKPLLTLNQAASKMASLDFSSKCNIQREDEIGHLADTLNFLSENLSNSLTSLKNANIKLEEDIEKERKLEKARKEFVAAVSHELKTPISLIGGYAEGLRDDIFDAEEKNYYTDVIIDESNKMANLVADMLDLSQLESGNFKLTKEDFYIDELLKCTLKKFYTIIGEKDITIEMNLTENIKVKADWHRLEQVITNFVTNAIRHTNPKGLIKVGIEDKKEKALIFIENSGSQIPKEEINKIWDNFYKIDKSRNRKFGGTGLGLAIVKNILDLHKSEYGVINTDLGVKFYFIIDKLN